MTDTTRVVGITDAQLKQLRKGGWQDVPTDVSPEWQRFFAGENEEDGCIRHWIFLGFDDPYSPRDKWCASVSGPKPGDIGVSVWADALDKALKHCGPPPGWKLKPAEEDCTAQSGKFAARDETRAATIARREHFVRETLGRT